MKNDPTSDTILRVDCINCKSVCMQEQLIRLNKYWELIGSLLQFIYMSQDHFYSECVMNAGNGRNKYTKIKYFTHLLV